MLKFAVYYAVLEAEHRSAGRNWHWRHSMRERRSASDSQRMRSRSGRSSPSRRAGCLCPKSVVLTTSMESLFSSFITLRRRLTPCQYPENPCALGTSSRRRASIWPLTLKAEALALAVAHRGGIWPPTNTEVQAAAAGHRGGGRYLAGGPRPRVHGPGRCHRRAANAAGGPAQAR